MNRTSTSGREGPSGAGIQHGETGPEVDAAPLLGISTVEPIAVDAGQAAALIGISKSMFYKLADCGRIGPVGVRFGRCLRYPLTELREWAAAGMPPRHEWAARHGQS